MTQRKQDFLLELCKPYLLDLLSLMAESLKYGDGCLSLSDLEALQDRLNSSCSSFSTETLEKASDLSYRQRASVIYEIAAWIDSAIQSELPIENIAPNCDRSS